MCTDLFKRSICQLQDVNNRDEAAICLYNRQIEIMSIYTAVKRYFISETIYERKPENTCCAFS